MDTAHSEKELPLHGQPLPSSLLQDNVKELPCEKLLKRILSQCHDRVENNHFRRTLGIGKARQEVGSFLYERAALGRTSVNTRWLSCM